MNTLRAFSMNIKRMNINNREEQVNTYKIQYSV